MNIRDKIVEKENRFTKRVMELRMGGYKTYIYGDGLGGKRVRRQLDLHGVKYDGIVVNQKYWNGSVDSICLEELLNCNDCN